MESAIQENDAAEPEFGTLSHLVLQTFDLAVAGIQGLQCMLQLLPPPLLLLLLLLLLLISLLIAADAQQLRVYHVVQLPVAAARQSITAKQLRTSL